jgi:hypothetical protein
MSQLAETGTRRRLGCSKCSGSPSQESDLPSAATMRLHGAQWANSQRLLDPEIVLEHDRVEPGSCSCCSPASRVVDVGSVTQTQGLLV